MSYETLKYGDFGLQMPAWLDVGDGHQPQACMIRELSNTSARLRLARTQTVPDRFLLRMNKSGSLSRACQVAKRQPGEVDVTFT